MSYWAERMREAKFDINDEVLRPYFPLPQVLEGLWELANKLFGIDVEAADGLAPVWQKDVRFFKISQNGEPQVRHPSGTRDASVEVRHPSPPLQPSFLPTLSSACLSLPHSPSLVRTIVRGCCACVCAKEGKEVEGKEALMPRIINQSILALSS